jgi:uncharacterized phage protein gp47/JayE
MSDTYGLTTDGFFPKTLEVIRDELVAALRSAFGPSLDFSDQSLFGQIVGILSEREMLLWELMEQVYNSQNPDAATGEALDNICLLTGTFRRSATHSIATLYLVGDSGTSVPAATQVRTSSTSMVFETLATVTISTVPAAWDTSTNYVAGDIVAASNGSIYMCRGGGAPNTYDEPSHTELFPSGSIFPSFPTPGYLGAAWIWLGTGDAYTTTTARSVDTGPIVALAQDLITIVTGVSGLNEVINLEDASIGADEGTDEDTRLLRQSELAAPGTGTINAIRAALFQASTLITNVTVFQNVDDVPDADGMPGHSVEALVRGGDDQLIFNTLLANVAAGIKTHGNTTGAATDSEGNSHVMKFSRPVEIPIYVEITLIKDPTLYPTDGDDLVKQAIADFGDLSDTGKNAVSSSLLAQAFNVTGVLEVTSCFIGTAPGPTLPTTIAIALRELATYDTSRITVISSDGTP